jgi:2-dehydro-3-deoxygluconokinase
VSAALVTAGEALVAILPDRPLPFERAAALQLAVGGAEVNFATCAAALGLPVRWYGHLGDDAPGRLVLAHLRHAGVDVADVQLRRGERTGVYLRDWQPDGQRRPTYYRAGSAARLLTADGLPESLVPSRWLHLTGITAALGADAVAAMHRLVERARSTGARISFDPNYREALWPAEAAVPVLSDFARRCDVLLMSDEDRQLLFGGQLSDEAALEAAAAIGPALVVLKQGARGARALDGDVLASVPALGARAVDPVGAGDAFNAGFVAALLRGEGTEKALVAAAALGALATETPSEHPSPEAIAAMAAR